MMNEQYYCRFGGWCMSNITERFGGWWISNITCKFGGWCMSNITVGLEDDVWEILL